MMLTSDWRSALLATVLLVACSEGAPTSPAPEVSTGPELVSRALRGRAAIELRDHAKLLEDGSVRVLVRAGCPRGFQVVEGPVSVIQGPEFQEIFGEGFFTVRCDGHWHLRKVRVVAPEGFERGTARVSASLDVENSETGEFLSASDNTVVQIH
jgi:uncharacterized protein (DUF58 family)